MLLKVFIWFAETWLILVYLVMLLPILFLVDLVNGGFKDAKECFCTDIVDIAKTLFKFKRGIW